MASYNTYGDPYAANPPGGGGYGHRENEDFSTPGYAHQSEGYNSHGASDKSSTVVPTPTFHGGNPSGSSISIVTPQGVGAEKLHPDDLDGVNTLGQIGGTERERVGRAGLHQPTSSFAAMGPPPRSTGILRMWRKDERGKQWFRGGGARSTLRLVCCCLTIGILMAISIILTVLMYIRPPAITLNNINFNQGAGVINPSTQTFHLAVNLSISVANPNWFDADFKKVSAEVKYNGGQFGGGQINNVNFKAYRVSTFDFPFYLNYSAKADPNGAMIKSLADSCGVTGGASTRQISINYRLKLWLRIFSATISPSFDSSATLDCPLDAEQIKQLMPPA